MEDIAHASEGELGEQVTVTAARVKAGALNQADLLRVQVAQANARQQGITARTQVTVARATLLGAIGLPPSDRHGRVCRADYIAPRRPARAVSAEVAQTRRPEIAQAELTAEAADHQARARGYALLPEVSLEGAYLRVDGQVFAPKNSAFVGVKAEWPIWEWGATESAHRAASAQADAAQRPISRPSETGCCGSDIAHGAARSCRERGHGGRSDHCQRRRSLPRHRGASARRRCDGDRSARPRNPRSPRPASTWRGPSTSRPLRGSSSSCAVGAP